jgi:uncharacterized protein
MHLHGSDFSLSATDLSNFLGCRHRTALDMALALGEREDTFVPDPLAEVLFQRGLAHEGAFVQSLREAGHEVLDLSDAEDLEAHLTYTLEAMRAGAEYIVQAALREGHWRGNPDVLVRVPKPSALGNWSYEVLDTKLARETRAGTILQLGLYSEMLAGVQGVRPEYFHVVTPDKSNPRHTYRLDDYAAYVRLVRRQMLETVALGHDAITAAHYPEPVDHCDVCRWDRECDQKRREDDHLSLVAGCGRLHRKELEALGLTTLTALAKLPLPLEIEPSRGSVETYVRLREQARLQHESRGKTPLLHELRAVVEKEGLCRLPEPSPGDVFLDLEGDPFAAEGGREYLFGVVTLDKDGAPGYRSFWALDEREERAAFEAVMDLIAETWQAHPAMHVYHYAPYEPSAFKRLMGRYATRERQLDDMLRSARFVDLYAIVRQALLVGTERYSIKNLEPLYSFQREVDLKAASVNLRVIEQALELGRSAEIGAEVRAAVEGYNRDDCISTLRLRDWLERVRDEAVRAGAPVPRPIEEEPEPKKVDERAAQTEALRARLLAGVPESRADRSREQQARWLLAYLLDYHRREDKAVWWEYYRLKESPEEDLIDEPRAIVGMTFVERIYEKKHAKTGKPTGTVIDRYQYPPQEMEIDDGTLKTRDGRDFGKVVNVERERCTLDVRKGRSRTDEHPACVFEHTYISTVVLEDAIAAIGAPIAGVGTITIGASTPHNASRALLLAQPPQLRSGTFERAAGEEILPFLRRVVLALDESILAVQGPPGAGKTYCGAQMVVTLVAEGRKVGITASSHKVIRNLLDAIDEAATSAGVSVRLGHRCDSGKLEPGSCPIDELETNEGARDALFAGEIDVLGGTAWLWARDDFANAVDVLFIDEAGQMSLANAVAVARAAGSVVLLGDPQQLEQPRKGTHPDGVSTSALQHMLGENQATISVDRGVFLDKTWRLCPAISAFTSEVFYEGKLMSKEGLERQRILGAGDLDGSGLLVMDTDHDGNRTSSEEEVDAVAQLVARLTSPGVRWTNAKGVEHPLRGEDVLVVAPYNAQVSRLTERLESTGARVGTVDKFQGQEAPVVIYSMATSRPEDAPRGMEFLYSLNRLNVATSRARCRAIVVASARLFEPECRTPRQIKLANALCRYRELACAEQPDRIGCDPSTLGGLHR